MTIHKNSMLVLTSGSYSDYFIRTIARAKINFSHDDVLREYLELYPNQKEAYSFKPDKFVHYLTSNNYIEEIDYRELHLEDYSSASEMELR